jgi:hypothetical protein
MAPSQQKRGKFAVKITIKLHTSITSQEPVHTAQYFKEFYGILTLDMFMDNQQQI